MKLFSKIVALTLLMAVFTGTFSNVIIGVAFYMEKEYIAREKCENRNNPASHCNGKCYLKKQLQKDDQREAQGVNFEKQEMVWFQTAVSTYNLLSLASAINHTDYYSFQLMPGYLRSVYHPPTA